MLSRGGAVLVDFALLEVKISRPWSSPGFSPHWQFPSLPLKDCEVVGKDIASYLLASATRRQPVVVVLRGARARARLFKRKG